MRMPEFDTRQHRIQTQRQRGEIRSKWMSPDVSLQDDKGLICFFSV